LLETVYEISALTELKKGKSRSFFWHVTAYTTKQCELALGQTLTSFLRWKS